MEQNTNILSDRELDEVAGGQGAAQLAKLNSGSQLNSDSNPNAAQALANNLQNALQNAMRNEADSNRANR